jgi:hypothetical protein
MRADRLRAVQDADRDIRHDGRTRDAGSLGIRLGDASQPGSPGPGSLRNGSARARVDAPRLYARVRSLARAQSADVTSRLAAEGVEVIAGVGRLAGPRAVVVDGREIEADAVLVATGAAPRVPPGAVPDRGADPDLAPAL